MPASTWLPPLAGTYSHGGFDGGLTLAYSDADRTCCLTFTDAAMSGGRTSRCVVLDAPCRRLRVVGDASSLEVFLNDGAAVLSTRYYPARGPGQHCGPPSCYRTQYYTAESVRRNPRWLVTLCTRSAKR